eukprot:CAMPEP_0194601302 /NCGR_PEP_ID=MMETSP0292-20121207/28933_1 /TAXON_ID=39354 /ORGANISM="Heterosigma akashiwo, Strain CCMP2393" /LENGTH=83 /DNA_ID=CAMNT_0039463247 /DNA_START=944 /DNA_END=1195 /DNA_ORIENTATION=-
MSGTVSAYSGKDVVEYGLFQHSGREINFAPAAAAFEMASFAAWMFAVLSPPTMIWHSASLTLPSPSHPASELAILRGNPLVGE